MTLEIGPAGDLYRVRGASEDGQRVFIETRNGQIATVDSDVAHAWPAGTILLVTRDSERTLAEPVPAEVWPEESWVGVVRLRLADVTVVDRSGQMRLIPTSDVECKVGNTVEGRDQHVGHRGRAAAAVRHSDASTSGEVRDRSPT